MNAEVLTPEIREAQPRRRGLWLPPWAWRMAVLIGIALIWEGLSRIRIVNPALLPPFSDVVRSLASMVTDRSVRSQIALTGLELGIAYLISVPVGVLIGVFLSRSEYWGRVLKPLLFFPLSIPKSVFLPLFILALGITVTQKVAFGVFSTVFIVILTTTTAVESISSDHVTVARSYGATASQIVWRVYVPSMLPVLLEGLRLAMIFNFTGIIVAEMYASRGGLGYLITSWGDSFAMPSLFAGIILVSLIAITFNELLRALERKCSHWRT